MSYFTTRSAGRSGSGWFPLSTAVSAWPSGAMGAEKDEDSGLHHPLHTA
jgi:hypothetical protein